MVGGSFGGRVTILHSVSILHHDDRRECYATYGTSQEIIRGITARDIPVPKKVLVRPVPGKRPTPPDWVRIVRGET